MGAKSDHVPSLFSLASPLIITTKKLQTENKGKKKEIKKMLEIILLV